MSVHALERRRTNRQRARSELRRHASAPGTNHESRENHHRAPIYRLTLRERHGVISPPQRVTKTLRTPRQRTSPRPLPGASRAFPASLSPANTRRRRPRVACYTRPPHRCPLAKARPLPCDCSRTMCIIYRGSVRKAAPYPLPKPISEHGI